MRAFFGGGLNMEIGGKKILIVGGTTGMGYAIAKASIQLGAQVIVASRSIDKVNKAATTLGENACGIKVDATNIEDISKMWAEIGEIDHLVIAAANIKAIGFLGSNIEDAQSSMDSKFWGAYRIIQNAKIAQNGSILLISGVASRKPGPQAAILSAINSALEAFGKALALELKPIRVNVICPGLIDTEFWDDVPENIKEFMFNKAKTDTPVGRVGQPEEIAQAAMALITNQFITGVVLDVDGGAMLTG